MKMRYYQEQARRTQNPNLTPRERAEHATWGLTSEVGEICGIFQKTHQGHELDRKALRKEVGDALWFIAELCDTFQWDMGCIAEENLVKLRKRYPSGFSVEQSINRAEGDI
jgi:NTP pyrophosphatase (non-canonical NTP hydrolase)